LSFPDDLPALAQAAPDDVCTGGNPREAPLEAINAPRLRS